jgi:hypothetical protein
LRLAPRDNPPHQSGEAELLGSEEGFPRGYSSIEHRRDAAGLRP